MTSAATHYQLQQSLQYTLRETPQEPIRQLQSGQESSLTIAQLLEIALGRQQNLPAQVAEYGAADLAQIRSVSDAVAMLGLDHMQATRLVAVLGLGRRLFQPSHGSMLVVRSAEQVYQATRMMAFLPKEQLRLLLINAQYQVFHEEVLAIGGDDWLQVEPRDILQPAIERRAKAFILVHNHPSGNPAPSEQDIAFTSRVAAAASILGLELLDHVVVAREGFASAK